MSLLYFGLFTATKMSSSASDKITTKFLFFLRQMEIVTHTQNVLRNSYTPHSFPINHFLIKQEKKLNIFKDKVVFSFKNIIFFFCCFIKTFFHLIMFFPNCGFFGASACGKVFCFYDISGVFGYNSFSFIKTTAYTILCVF